jgi:hypothetical protein
VDRLALVLQDAARWLALWAFRLGGASQTTSGIAISTMAWPGPAAVPATTRLGAWDQALADVLSGKPSRTDDGIQLPVRSALWMARVAALIVASASSTGGAGGRGGGAMSSRHAARRYSLRPQWAAKFRETAHTSCFPAARGRDGQRATLGYGGDGEAGGQRGVQALVVRVVGGGDVDPLGRLYLRPSRRSYPGARRKRPTAFYFPDVRPCVCCRRASLGDRVCSQGHPCRAGWTTAGGGIGFVYANCSIAPVPACPSGIGSGRAQGQRKAGRDRPAVET